jgi:hypothetical protein
MSGRTAQIAALSAVELEARAASRVRTTEKERETAGTTRASSNAITRAPREACVEGMKEMFTLQRLKIPETLHKCLATANTIESPQGGVERRTQRHTLA